VKTKIVIFASGNGSNAEEIIRHFEGHMSIEVTMILSNNKDAYVLERAKNHKIPYTVFNREEFYKKDTVDKILSTNKTDYIVLAGFMWLVPARLVRNYPKRIFNIHPALLPKYGGKGMYGSFVHAAVVENKEKESGITIHWVNEEYDKGSIIKQVKCTVSPSDNADDVADKVHQLEYAHYPKVIEESILKKSK
jgi:phosphoribosylglycinamide formyltransferase 1